MNRILLCAVAVLAGDPKDRACPTVPEIMLVQDSSASLDAVHKAMSKDIVGLLGDWALSFGTPVKLGFASFTDKPLPMRGWGGRYATGWKDIDTCWDFGTAVTSDYDLVETEFAKVTLRDGGDFAEAQLEALLYAARDKRVGFTDPSIVRDEEGRLVTRIALIITDDVPHVEGDAVAGIEHYNSPRQADGYGGWGDSNFFAFQGAIWQNNSYPYTIEGYQQMSLLLLWEELGEDLYPDEVEELAQLKKAYAPSKWETTVVPHDGLYTKNSCSTKDYPALSKVKAAVDDASILPVVLVTAPGQKMIDPEAQKACRDEFGYEYDEVANHFKDPSVLVPCLVWHYTTTFEKAGIDAVVASFQSPDDVVKAVKEAVLAASDFNCHLVNPTDAPVEPTDAPIVPTDAPVEPTDAPIVPTDAPVEPTDAPVVPTDAPVEPTDAPVVPTDAPVEPTEAPVKPTDKPTRPTRPDHDDDDDDHDDDDDDDDEGSNTAVIAGATGGAVAGVAALAGLLYKQFGAGLFGGNSTPQLSAAEQVESPETRVEREGVEEVTMDMFQ